ncbi:AsnC family transcriptional regulator [Aureimonas endophytica]|uniref:AsnC family transcriptional regulator n=1 Tax=Aureimonas endophytica TaxID=2027858 RepID=A0A916ZZX2_9HYPH|nr:Lrp/AsnC ligand binding domain-containing protein [Aureimonas endophytica]GGE20512.1 AsnC family transcriptional regulator [Aureimonas endophytica]
MQTIFVQFKCRPGRAYAVADGLVEAIEEVSEVYSTSGHYDLIAKFYLPDERDIGHFVTERLQTLDGVADTFTTVAFKAFGRG